tara:strand:- start:412 stop:699 length:288 start_codon:yes stop_codon:yes gene_type:complete
MAKFTSETARAAGKRSRRGVAKSTIQTRKFIFDILRKNRSKLQYMLEELTPREFVDFYLRLLPYIIAPRTMQKIDVSEISKDEITDMVKDIVDGD